MNKDRRVARDQARRHCAAVVIVAGRLPLETVEVLTGAVIAAAVAAVGLAAGLAFRASERDQHTIPATDSVVPQGVDDLVSSLGFARIHTMRWWQKFTSGKLRIVMTPAQHWGKRFFNDHHREYGGYVLQSRSHSHY